MLFIKNQLLRHAYGGFYRYIGVGLDTETGEAKVAYKHVWPFEKNKLFFRPETQFIDGRFQPVTLEDLALAKKIGRKAYQDKIKETKQARKLKS